MRTWVIKPEFRRPGVWPDDMMVVELDDNVLLYVQHDGTWDLSPTSAGYPTARMFDVYE